jgi:hypothetical protein
MAVKATSNHVMVKVHLAASTRTRGSHVWEGYHAVLGLCAPVHTMMGLPWARSNRFHSKRSLFLLYPCTTADAHHIISLRGKRSRPPRHSHRLSEWRVQKYTDTGASTSHHSLHACKHYLAWLTWMVNAPLHTRDAAINVTWCFLSGVVLAGLSAPGHSPFIFRAHY